MQRTLWLSGLIALAFAAPALADTESGPGRTTLRTFPFGTLYVVEDKVAEWEVVTGLDGTTVRTPGGGLTVRSDGPNAFTLEWPKSKMRVYAEVSGLSVTWDKAEYTFRRELSVFKVVVPGDEVRFVRATDGVQIAGKRGKVRVTTSFGTTIVESSAGRTEIVESVQRTSRRGPPLSKHPYLARGFYLERDGLGLFIDLWKVNPLGGPFARIDWTPWVTGRP